MGKTKFKSLEDMKQYVRDTTMLQRVMFEQKFGSYFLSQRVARGLSIEQVSEETGVTVGVLDLIERGKRRMRWGATARLLRYYDSWIEIRFVPMPDEMKGKLVR